MKDCLYIDEKSFYSMTDEAREWFKTGLTLGKSGRYTEAIEYFDKILKIFPNNANTLLNKGLALAGLGRHNEAINYYNQVIEVIALEIKPRVLLALLNKSHVLNKLTRYDEAIECMDEATKIDPNFIGVWYNKGVILRKLGRDKEAIKCFDEELKHLNEASNVNYDIPYDKRYADLWYNRGISFYHLGNYEEAIKCYDKVTEIKPDYTSAWYEKGLILDKLKNYEEAIKCYDKALEIDPNYLQILDTKGKSFEKAGNYEEAIKCYDKALEIDPNYDAALANKVTVLKKLNKVNYVQRYFEIAKQLAISLNRKGLEYYRQGEYSKAEDKYLRALQINHTVFGENHLEVAITFDNLGELYRASGDYRKAWRHYMQARDIFLRTVGEYSYDYVVHLTARASMYYSIDDVEKAKVYLLKAKEIIEKLPIGNHIQVANQAATILDNLSSLYRDMGEYSKAEPLNKQALDIYRQLGGESSYDYAISLENMANLYENMGKFTDSETKQKQALDIYRQLFGENNASYALATMNLGVNYLIREKYTEAEQSYVMAQEILLKTRGESHPDYLKSLKNLSNLYTATHRYNDALKTMKKVIAIEDKMIYQIFSISSETQRMVWIRHLQTSLYQFLSLIVEHFSGFIQIVYMALDLVLKRKALDFEALASQRDVLLEGKYPQLRAQLNQRNILAREIDELIMHKVRNGKLSSDDRRPLDTKFSEKEELEEYLANQIPEMSLERRLKEVDSSKISAALTKEAALIGTKEAALIEYVRIDIPNLHFLQVKKGKQQEEELQLNLAIYVAFVLIAGKQDTIKMKDLGRAESIDKAVANFRNSIKNNSEFDVKINYGSALRAAIFDPLKTDIEGCRRLFIATDGELARVPFGVLPYDCNNDRYLLDNYDISYLSTARDLLLFSVKANGESKDPLVAVDPDFNLSSNNSVPQSSQDSIVEKKIIEMDQSHLGLIYFRPLPQTGVEGEFIGDMLNVKPLIKDKVLESNIKACRSPRILHIATHGFFIPTKQEDTSIKEMNSAVIGSSRAPMMSVSHWRKLGNPLLRSGLALAGANTWSKGGILPKDAEDGLLTAADVTAMDLTNTELVVLSACDTGLGDFRIGEGVFGLRRSFVLAGAKALVMSLWRVPDEQTRELMVLFYDYLLQGKCKSRLDALQAAQMQMKERYPYNIEYWGAFIYQGNPGQL